MIADPKLLAGKSAPELKGLFSQEDALARLLAGSGLGALPGPGGVLMIRPIGRPLAPAAPERSEEIVPVAEVIVTAERRPGLAFETPISLTTLSGRELERLGLVSMDEVSRLAPGLNVAAASPATAGFSMRGITQASGDATREPRLSVFQDGAPASKERGAYFELFDLERIEIAKGPQSTLFGRSAMTGAINVIQRKASLEGTEGYAGLALGDHGLISIDAALNRPIGESAAVRIAGRSRRRDGMVENLLGGPAQQSIATDAIRISLRVAPSANFSADLILNYEHDRPTGAGMKSLVYSPTDPMTGDATGGLGRYDGLALAAPDENGAARRLGLDRELASATALAQMELGGGWGLSGLLSARRFAADELQDADGTALPVVSLLEQTRGVEQSLEARLEYDTGAGWRGFVGLNLFSEHGTQRVPIVVDERPLLARIAGGLSEPPQSLAELTAPAFLTDQIGALVASRGTHIDPASAAAIAAQLKPAHLELNQNFSRTRSLDVFADASFRPSLAWEFSVGLRYSLDHKESAVAPSNPEGPSTLGTLLAALGMQGPGRQALLADLALGRFRDSAPYGMIFHPTVGNGNKISDDLNDSGWSWRLVARYAPTEDVSLYGSYARGRRPMVLVAGAPTTPYGPARFGRAPAETVDSVELGAKTNLAGGRLQLDGVVYAYAYNDFQTTRFIDGLLRTVNAGEARAHGSELEARWRLADHARLVATYGYNRARLTTGAMKGNRFRLAPDHKASLRLEISRDVPRATLVFSPSYAWQSTIYFSDDNDLPSLSRGLAPDLTQDERQDPYGVLDLTLSYRHASGWTVTGFVRNVLDQQYIVDAGFIGESYGFSASARGPARTAGVSALIRF